MLNLPCRPVFGRWWMSAFGMFRLVPTSTRSMSSARILCVAIRRSSSVIAGWASEPDGNGLMEMPGDTERPRPAQLRDEGVGVVGPRRRPEETARRFQDLVAGCPANGDKIHGHDAGLGRATGVECLGRRPEVLPQAGGRTAGNSQHAGDSCRVERPDLRGRSGGAERSHGSGGVKAVLIVPGCHRLGDLALHFHADVIRQHQVAPGPAAGLGQGQGRREGRGARVRQQPVLAIAAHGELGVVVIVAVDADAVQEGGEARRKLRRVTRSPSHLPPAVPALRHRRGRA